MNDDLFKKMELDFNEESKNETVFDQKDKMVEELEESSDRSVLEAKETEHIIENDKKQTKKEKDSNKSKATTSLVKSIGWIIVMILSIAFGIVAIKEFIEKVINFIDSATQDEVDGLASTGKFFTAFAYSFEAGLFIFFILYSLKMFIKNLIPWKEYRKETEPARLESEISKIKITEEKWEKKCISLGIEINTEDLSNLEPKKELKVRKAEVKKLKAKYNATKKDNSKSKQESDDKNNKLD